VFADHAEAAGAPQAPPDDWLHAVTRRPGRPPERTHPDRAPEPDTAPEPDPGEPGDRAG
jgi:hypothetical protein